MPEKQIKYMKPLKAKGMKQICIIVPIGDIPIVKALVAEMREKHLTRRTQGLNEEKK